MPLTGHSPLQDRAKSIHRRFDERRRRELCASLTPEVEAEFCADVEGRRPRSLALRQLLNFMRMSPIEGRSFAYAAPPYQQYFLARLHADRGVPPTVDRSRSFGSKREAIIAVFRARLAEIKAAVSDGGGGH